MWGFYKNFNYLRDFLREIEAFSKIARLYFKGKRESGIINLLIKYN
jgi:hypothetical protein